MRERRPGDIDPITDGWQDKVVETGDTDRQLTVHRLLRPTTVIIGPGFIARLP
jgi:hypothetical protein